MPKPVITAHSVDFAYGSLPVLRDVDLEVTEGETVCLTGPNGCGKSTLLKVLIGELRHDAGHVEVLGQRVDRRRGLHHVGYVPQTNTIASITFPITSLELAVQGLAREFGWVKIPRRSHHTRARETFERLGLEDFTDVPFRELSGGLQQRVMIARALLIEPRLVVLDEPTSGVDTQSRTGLLSMLDRLRADTEMTILIVTHDLPLVAENMHVDAVYRMHEGSLRDAAAVV